MPHVKNDWRSMQRPWHRQQNFGVKAGIIWESCSSRVLIIPNRMQVVQQATFLCRTLPFLLSAPASKKPSEMHSLRSVLLLRTGQKRYGLAPLRRSLLRSSMISMRICSPWKSLLQSQRMAKRSSTKPNPMM